MLSSLAGLAIHSLHSCRFGGCPPSSCSKAIAVAMSWADLGRFFQFQLSSFGHVWTLTNRLFASTLLLLPHVITYIYICNINCFNQKNWLPHLESAPCWLRLVSFCSQSGHVARADMPWLRPVAKSPNGTHPDKAWHGENADQKTFLQQLRNVQQLPVSWANVVGSLAIWRNTLRSSNTVSL